MSATPDSTLANHEQRIADLERQLAEREAELAEALQRETATVEVLQVINRSPGDLAPVFEAILEKALSLCEAALGSMVRFDGDAFHWVAARGVPEAWFAEFTTPAGYRPTPGLALYRFLHSGENIEHVSDIAADDSGRSDIPDRRRFAELSGARTAIWVALRKDQALLGAFVIYRREVRPFSQKQIALLRNFAGQAVIAMENARLLGELRERTSDLEESLEYQTATSDVLKVISRSTSDVQPVLDTVIETAARLCGADGGGITIREGEVYRYVSSSDSAAEPEFCETLRQRTIVPGRDSVAGRVLLEGRVVHVADVSADPDYALPEAVAAGQRTILGVPLLREGAVLGTINLSRNRVQPFTERQIELVRTFADQAVIAIENARLLGELRERTSDLEESLEYQTATSDVLKVISRSTSDVQAVMDTVVETAVRLCGADSAAISIREGEVYRPVASSFSAAEPEYWAIQRQRTIVAGRNSVPGRVALEGKVVHVADILADPDYAVPEAVAAGRRTNLGVPLLRDSERIGVITLTRKRVEPFTERQIELVRTFADQAVIAMENARLLGELQARTRDLEESLEYQTATSDVLQAISRSTFDLQPVLDALVATAARLCNAEAGHITRREGDVYRIASTFALTPEWDDAVRLITHRPGDGTLVGRTALAQHAVHIEDVATDTEHPNPEVTRLGKLHTLLGVPLLREGEPIGVISLARQRVEPFTERQIELVRTFADQAVIAMENARLLTETREALEQQTATAEVLQVINSSPGNLEPVFDAILDKARAVCGFAQGSLNVYDGEYFRTVATRGIPEPFAEALRQPRRIGPQARFLEGDRIVHITDTAAERPDPDDPVYRAAIDAGVRTVLFVPLRNGQRLLGYITANRREVRPFSEKEITLLENFAAQAVIAMENARLITETREALEQQTATAQVLQVINSSPGDLAPVFDALLQKATRLCEANYGLLAL